MGSSIPVRYGYMRSILALAIFPYLPKVFSFLAKVSIQRKKPNKPKFLCLALSSVRSNWKAYYRLLECAEIKFLT